MRNTEREKLFRRFNEKLIVNPLLTRKLVSLLASKAAPFYRWLRYREAFCPVLVDYLYDKIQESSAANLHILDPFAGTGTALTRACARNWKATGIEALPVGVHALKARLSAATVDLEDFERTLRRLRDWNWRKPKSGYLFPHLRITQDAFPRETERHISSYVQFLDEIDDENVKFFFWFACLSVLEQVSYTRKDGQYLRWDNRSGRKLAGRFYKGVISNFPDAVCERLHEFYSDLVQGNGGMFSRNAKIIEGSCLLELPTLPAEAFDAILTSPPYCNRFDYTRTYALELAFCGYGEEGIRRLRQTLLSATVENKSKRDSLMAYYENLGGVSRYRAIASAFDGQRALHEVLYHLSQAKERNELSNVNLPTMLENYFFEMALVVFEMARVLKRGGRVLMVNDNVRYHGEEVPVDLILSDFAERAGLLTERIWVLPSGKGNSSQQMGRWGRVELRKCIYCWRKQ